MLALVTLLATLYFSAVNPQATEVPETRPQVAPVAAPGTFAVLVSSANPDEAKSFSKKLVTELQRSPDLRIVEVEDLVANELRATAASKHYAYFLTATLSSKKKRAIRTGRFPMGTSSEIVWIVSWQLEKTGNANALYFGDISGPASAKGEDAQLDMARRISAIAIKSIEDDSGPNQQTKDNSIDMGRPRLDIQTNHATQVSDFVYSQDGKMLATLAIDGVVKIWVAQEAYGHKFHEIRTFAGYRIAGFALSPDGNMLATVDVKRTVRVIDTHAGVIVKTIFARDQNPPANSYLSLTFNPIPVAYSPKDRTVVYGGNDGAPVVDVDRGLQLRTIRKGSGAVGALALSADGDLVATASGGTEQGPARSWRSYTPFGLGGPASAEIVISRTNTGESIQKKPFPAFMGSVSALAFGPKGDTLVAGSPNGTIRIFDVQSGKTGEPLEKGQCDLPYEIWRKTNSPPIFDKVFTGPLIGFCKQFVTMKAAYTRDLNALTPAAGVRSLAISEDGKLLADVQADNTIWLRKLSGEPNKVELAKAEQSAATSAGNPNDVNAVLYGFLRSSVKFSYDQGKYHVNCIRGFKTVSRWDATTYNSEGEVNVAKRELSPYPIPFPMGAVPEFSKDKSRLLTASLTNGVKIWDLKTGTAEQISNTPVFLNVMPISADGRHVLTCEQEANTPKKKFRVSMHEVGTQRADSFEKIFDNYALPAFSPDSASKYVALWEMNNGALHIYDRSGNEVKTVKPDPGKAVMGFAFSPDSDSLAYLTEDRTINVIPMTKGGNSAWSTNLSKATESLFHPATFVFSEDGSLLAFIDGAKIRVFNLRTRQPYRERVLPSSTDLSNLVFVPGQKCISFTTDHSLSHWNLDTDKVTNSALITDFWGNLTYYPDGRFLALGGTENRVRLFDVKNDVEIGSLIAPSDNDWLMVTPDGYFDASRLEDVDEVYWIVKEEPVTTQPMELFTRQSYVPRLLPALLDNDPLPSVDSKKFKEVNRSLPVVTIDGIVPVGPDSAKVSVTVQQTTSAVQLDDKGRPLASGAFNLRLFRDGLLVGYSKPYGEAIKLDASGKASLEFIVPVPHSITPRQLDFSAYALNSTCVKGLTVHSSYELPVSPKPPNKRAYIVVMGVNSNEANVLSSLMFAASDAKLIAKSLSEKLKATKLYSDVVIIQLLTAQGAGSGTKQKLNAVLNLLAGHAASPSALNGIDNVSQLHKAGPDDLVFVFFAGHGYATKGKFYLFPSDLGKSVGTDISRYLRRTISDDDLSAWFRDIDAGDLVLVVDSCNSAATVDPRGEFRAGPLGNPGMGQLAYDKGMRVLAAAERDKPTMEQKQKGSGDLTYALVKEGFEGRQADFYPEDGKISMGEWLSYSTKSQEVQAHPDRTPVLYNFLWKQQDPLIAIVPRQTSALPAHDSSPQQIYRDLQTVAKVFLEDRALRPRISIANGVLDFNFDSIPYEDLVPHPDRLVPALEILIRVQQVKSELTNKLPNEQFWRHFVDAIEKIPPEIINAALQTESEEAWQGKCQKYEEDAQKLFSGLGAAMEHYAATAYLNVQRSRGPLEGYEVRVRIGPPSVRVRYMSAGAYQYCKTFRRSTEDEWLDLKDHEVLIGRYHYIVDWPQRPVEGQFEVSSTRQVLSFPPPTADGK